MADPVSDAPAIDEFAQTRGGDDLFDDEIVPVPIAEQKPEPEVHAEPAPVPVIENDTQPARTETSPRSRGGERRGRGRGRGRSGRGSHNSGRRGDGAVKSKPTESATEREDQSAKESTPETPAEGDQTGKEDITSSDPKAAGAEGPRVPAVRGDRSATGGIKKLTEEELSRRIAAAKENAAKKAAAHARAEADQASFLEREKVAEEKRRQERQHRRVMDNERERNRLRKLNALNGREWDAEKKENEYNPRGGGGRGQFRRGMHGGVSGYTRRDFDSQAGEEPLNEDTPQHYRGRGRGGRGGRGRGGHRESRGERTLAGTSDPSTTGGSKPEAPAPVITNEAEFPALPGSEKKNDDKAPLTPDLLKSDSLSPVTGASWAEQVESQ
ncbi:hypothetical protein BO94DRAFT_113646 [Aspergillus sclerotioniger CBS 115572]|uniref:Uncharacterized protein n=1 Tax=Aspergillus sclerotioniger CBS 115572 TaxID=1450535 RepID=A0A317WB77_9EURO|nr:hypothetical protein BO94DRAFT_113646 [Aspergillus sclerotioniger CBS 115572]PWY83744.1 hypothetical protein BO94DRAFT_113646 [Aspergillus sclerotioniger CBS 115572]